MNSNGKTLGLFIKEKRVEKGMKQFELADRLGISRAYLSDIENCRYLPSLKLLLKLNKELKFLFFV